MVILKFSIGTTVYLLLLLFRSISFDLVVEREPFLEGLQSLEDAVSSFLHLAFVANMHYPEVGTER
jgi:hypothetical protein